MIPDLPPALRQSAHRLLEGVTRKGLAERAGKISEAYRAGRTSAAVVKEEDDAVAYVLARLPATYAACVRALHEAALIAPDFAPATLLDAGAGPGGASWAALETWPDLAQVTLLDSNRTFLDMAATLAAQAGPVLREAVRLKADLATPDVWPQAELVIASYALAEIAGPRQAATVDALWAACEGVLVLVEPGTPDGWRRILSAREALIAAGAAILAPCPHALACPIIPPDWCHFVQRLPRSRDHRAAKGAEVPFEDEKFIYLVAARPCVAAATRTARILAPPRASKPAIALKLCSPAGTLEEMIAPKRDKPGFAVARRLDWGDALP